MKLLIYRIGQLGDTLISLPSFHVLRRQFPSAQIILLSNRFGQDSQISAEALLRDTGLVDSFISYVPGHKLRFAIPGILTEYYNLWRQLAALKLDCVVYLLPSSRSRLQTWRDRLFFATLGVKRLIGFTYFNHKQIRPAVSEADLLLARLAASGIPVPEKGKGEKSLPITRSEEFAFEQWAARTGLQQTGKFIAVGPGSKMPSKIWPVERYIAVILKLRNQYGFVPIVFGSSEDRALGDRIISECGGGFNAAGELSVKASLAALRRCRFYLGNDTGTMHLAASVELPCVAVFSQRSIGEFWFPYGVPCRVIRTEVPCKGCELYVCTVQKMRCILEISVEQTFSACESLIEAEALG